MKILYLIIEYDKDKEKDWGYNSFSEDCFEHFYLCDNIDSLNLILNSYKYSDDDDSWIKANMKMGTTETRKRATELNNNLSYSSLKEYCNETHNLYYEKGKLWLGNFYNRQKIEVNVYAIELTKKKE